MTAVPLTSYPFDESSPAFSPDGNQVAFVWRGPKGDNADVYVKLVGEDVPVRLTKDPLRDDAPAWSSDGHWIAFLRHREMRGTEGAQADQKSAVIVIPATGGPERGIAEIHSPAGFARISWDASSRWLAVPDKGSPQDAQSLYLLSAKDGEKRRLTFPPPSSYGDEDPSFSPDGRSIAFIRSKREPAFDLYVLRLADDLMPKGEPARVTSGRTTRSPAWSADGSSMVYASGSYHNPRLWRTWFPQSGARPGPTELLAFAGQGARAPAISSQGRLAFEYYQTDADIQRLELAGSPANPRAPNPPATLIASSRLDHTPQYSPDGSLIAFASDRSGNDEIWVCDRDGSNALPLTSFDGAYTADPLWSPDGRWIAFRSYPEGGEAIYLVRASGGALKKLTGSDLDAGVCGWSRDGKWVYYSSGPTNDRRIRKAPLSGGPPLPVTAGPGAGRAVESVDGRFLFYLRTEDAVSSLWKMPLPSGKPVEVLDSVYGFNFAVTETGVFFIGSATQPSIDFLRFADNKKLTVARMGRARPAYGMSLSPDGRSLLFGLFNDHPSDLMLVENFR